MHSYLPGDEGRRGGVTCPGQTAWARHPSPGRLPRRRRHLEQPPRAQRRTGKINWILGGKHSSFTVQAAPGQTLDSANELFAWQHDPEQVGQNTFTWFDNDSTGTPLLPSSRAVTVKLNPQAKVATLVASDNQPEGLSAASQGNAQTTRNGDLFVGWGALPYFSEFSPSGQLLFNAEFPAGVNSYRAYRLPWFPGTGHPDRG